MNKSSPNNTFGACSNICITFTGYINTDKVQVMHMPKMNTYSPENGEVYIIAVRFLKRIPSHHVLQGIGMLMPKTFMKDSPLGCY
jgi:hypothetical protein